MKRYFTILFVALLSTGVVLAQNLSHSILGAKISVQDFEYNAESVTLNLIFDIEDLQIGSTQSVVFLPHIYKGEQQLELPTVVIRSRGGAKAYNRSKALNNTKSMAVYDQLIGTPYTEVNYYGSFDKTQLVEYSLTIPYETWMVDSHVVIDCKSYGCCNAEYTGMLVPEGNKLLIDMPAVEDYEIVPYVQFIKPAKVAVKRRDVQYSSALIFKVNSTVIDPDLSNNQQELNSIDAMMQSVLSDKDYTITGVEIIGYASPEGTLATNMRLSEGRAKALEVLMKQKYSMINPRLYSVAFGGENWDKLAELVEDGDLQDKDQVLSIIRNIPIENGREKALMDLNGGVPYKYLLKNVFPSTRLVVVDVEYNIADYDLDRIKELIYAKPQNLSLEEMYRLSEVYSVEDKTFEDIFMTAVKLYPDDEVALHNALVTEIRLGKAHEAADLVAKLDHNTNSQEIANTLGVYYMLTGDYEQSKTMLLKAESLGSDMADSNLEELAAKEKNLVEVAEYEKLKAEIYGN